MYTKSSVSSRKLSSCGISSVLQWMTVFEDLLYTFPLLAKFCIFSTSLYYLVLISIEDCSKIVVLRFGSAAVKEIPNQFLNRQLIFLWLPRPQMFVSGLFSGCYIVGEPLPLWRWSPFLDIEEHRSNGKGGCSERSQKAGAQKVTTLLFIHH